MLPQTVYNPILFFHAESRCPLQYLTMATSGSPLPTMPEGFMEYFALLSQNSTLLSTLQTPPPSTTSPPTVPLTHAPAQGHLFSRPNRGTGGVLIEKQKVSKEITAPATKHKSLVNPQEIQVSPVSEVTEDLNPRQAKRPKVTKACGCS